MIIPGIIITFNTVIYTYFCLIYLILYHSFITYIYNIIQNTNILVHWFYSPGQKPSGYTKYEKDGCQYNIVKYPVRAQFETAKQTCRIEGDRVGRRGMLAEARNKEDRYWLIQLWKRTLLSKLKYLTIQANKFCFIK